MLLDGGAKWDIMNSIGAAAFHAAGNVQVLQVHLDHGADIRLPTRAGANNSMVDPYSYCVSMAARGHLDVLKFVHDTFPGIFAEEANSFDPLVHAMLRDHPDCVNFLLPLSDLSRTFKNLGMNALHCAAEFGRESLLRQIVEAFQEKGLSLDMKDNDEDTPLHTAILNTKLDAFKVILEAGADPLATFKTGAINENSGVTMLMAFGRSEYANRDTQCVAFAEAILAHPRAHELIEMKDSDGMTALHYACHSVPICKMLLAKGADVDAQREEGNTPLHMAAYFPRGEHVDGIEFSADVFCLLLEGGADPDIKDNEGMRAEDYLRETYPLKTEMRLRWAVAKRREGPWLEIWLKQVSWITMPALAIGAMAARLLYRCEVCS
jgi:ankyrin repeat protein